MHPEILIRRLLIKKTDKRQGELRRTGEKSINIQYVVVLVKIMENFRVGVDGVGALCSLLAVALIAKSNPLKPCGSFRHLEVSRRL